MEIRHERGYCEIILAGSLFQNKITKDNIDSLQKLIDSPTNIIIDGSLLLTLDKDWNRHLMNLAKKVREADLKFYWIGLSDTLKKQIISEGLENVFPLLDSKKAALQKIGITSTNKPKLDVNYVNPFIAATIRVLELQANVKSKQKSLYLKKAGETVTEKRDISGVMGVVSTGYTGSVVISFSEATFLAIMSEMIGEQYKVLTPALADGAGELTNIIFGQAKTELNQKGYGLEMALPSIVTGANHSVLNKNTIPSMIVVFESTAGDFFIEISLA